VSLKLRAARRDDLPAVYDLLETAFPEARRQLFVALTEADSTFRLRHARVAVRDGHIIGHVRIFARRMRVRGVPLPAGGIGSVATHPDAQHRGIASMLMRDAVDQMRRDGVAVSFLFTGIPGFYERLGYRIVREPSFTANAAEAAALAAPSMYDMRPATEADVPRLVALHRAATIDTTGSVCRTRRQWRDAQSWLAEAPQESFVAELHGRIVAYVRTRCRTYGHEIMELQHRPGHADAVAPLVAASARIALAHGELLVALAPDGHQLAVTLATLPSTRSTTDVRYPMMMRIVSLDATLRALLPWLSTRAAGHPGTPFRARLRTLDESAVLDVRARTVALRTSNAAADLDLDPTGTLDALLGQHLASRSARPRPPSELRRRFDALFPPAPLHFWNSDRI
jgi:predicted N-acetyltransferase YhbS